MMRHGKDDSRAPRLTVLSNLVCVRTLGVVAIDVGERRIGPSSGRLFALLLYLVFRRGDATSRRVVQELLFPEATDGQAAHSLRQLLYRLRQIGVPIEADADQLSIGVEQISVDCWVFLETGEPSKAELERVVHGLFPGYSPAVSEPFREWFEVQRADVSLQLCRALGLHLAKARHEGRWDVVDVASRALLALDPLSEEGTLAKAEVLAASGSKRAALGVIDDYLREVADGKPQLRLSPSALRRRISERLPEANQLTPDDRMFVGREEMMRMLGTMASAARTGSQQVLLVWGEPGIGKTRLLVEYRALYALQGGTSQFLSCQPHDVFRPLGILCDLIVSLLQAPGALGCDPGARELLERMVSTNTHVGAVREEITAEAPLTAIVRSLSDLVTSVAVESPVLILVDDAQWLDQGSLSVIIGVFAGRSARRSCLVLASRNRALVAGADSYSDTIFSVRLHPLAHEPAQELARNLLNSTPCNDAEAVERHVLEQAKGNPFFIRLLCSHFLATTDTGCLKQTVSEI